MVRNALVERIGRAAGKIAKGCEGNWVNVGDMRKVFKSKANVQLLEDHRIHPHSLVIGQWSNNDVDGTTFEKAKRVAQKPMTNSLEALAYMPSDDEKVSLALPDDEAAFHLLIQSMQEMQAKLPGEKAHRNTNLPMGTVRNILVGIGEEFSAHVIDTDGLAGSQTFGDKYYHATVGEQLLMAPRKPVERTFQNVRFISSSMPRYTYSAIVSANPAPKSPIKFKHRDAPFKASDERRGHVPEKITVTVATHFDVNRIRLTTLEQILNVG